MKLRIKNVWKNFGNFFKRMRSNRKLQLKFWKRFKKNHENKFDNDSKMISTIHTKPMLIHTSHSIGNKPNLLVNVSIGFLWQRAKPCLADKEKSTSMAMLQPISYSLLTYISYRVMLERFWGFHIGAAKSYYLHHYNPLLNTICN